jgi:hypothetical protein
VPERAEVKGRIEKIVIRHALPGLRWRRCRGDSISRFTVTRRRQGWNRNKALTLGRRRNHRVDDPSIGRQEPPALVAIAQQATQAFPPWPLAIDAGRDRGATHPGTRGRVRPSTSPTGTTGRSRMPFTDQSAAQRARLVRDVEPGQAGGLPRRPVRGRRPRRVGMTARPLDKLALESQTAQGTSPR